MTWRELQTFVRHLPQDSAYGRAVLGEAADWGVDAYLLARVANLIQQGNSSKRVPDSQLIKPPTARAAPEAEPQAGGAAELDALFTGGS